MLHNELYYSLVPN